jgi:hypothetical protein
MGGSWLIEIADKAESVGAYTSLAIDASGNPHVSYCDASNGDLKYAVRIGGFWVIETVDSDGSVGWYTSLALDAQGNPHISYSEHYYEGTPYSSTLVNALKYAVKKNASWECVVVDKATVQFSSLALDAEGNPHIGYYEYDNTYTCILLIGNVYQGSYVEAGVPKYAVGIDGFWALQTVDEGFVVQEQYCVSLDPDCQDCNLTTVDLCPSVALDTKGNPHISYYDAANGNLKCAVKDGRFWVVDTVDHSANVGSFSSLAHGVQ